LATSTYPLNGRVSLKGKKIGLFIPCYIDLVYPEVGVATLELLEKFGLDVGFPLDQTCCGQPMSNSGDEANSLAAERLFVSNFQDFDYIIGPHSGTRSADLADTSHGRTSSRTHLMAGIGVRRGNRRHYCGRSSLSLATPA
jgi:Cysteine-rich domain